MEFVEHREFARRGLADGWNILIRTDDDGRIIACLRWNYMQEDFREVPSRERWRARRDGAPSPFSGELGQYVDVTTRAEIEGAVAALWSSAPTDASPPRAIQFNIAHDQVSD